MDVLPRGRLRRGNLGSVDGNCADSGLDGSRVSACSGSMFNSVGSMGFVVFFFFKMVVLWLSVT